MVVVVVYEPARGGTTHRTSLEPHATNNVCWACGHAPKTVQGPLVVSSHTLAAMKPPCDTQVEAAVVAVWYMVVDMRSLCILHAAMAADLLEKLGKPLVVEEKLEAIKVAALSHSPASQSCAQPSVRLHRMTSSTHHI